jgi:putative DNA methylase
MSDTPPRYPKRLIEVDLPIARISAHSRREKSIRHGHISTLHIWWARRPLAACRAVICAALWPDPADELCPPRFRADAFRILNELRTKVVDGMVSDDRMAAYGPVTGMTQPKDAKDLTGLRKALLDFIAEFANWDLSTNSFFLEASRAITQSAHESLGGEPGTRPLVVDPFAGGGSIPLEALRVGADAFASDLNPIPVLLNKVVLEYIPRYGQRLADEVRKWGAWIKREAEKELTEFYPKDKDGSTPIAYLWARTILSEAPGQGEIPVEVPLMRSLWLAKKAGRRRALRWVRDKMGKVETQTVDVAYVEDGQRVVKRVERPLLEIFEPAKESDVEGGTVARGSATCPVTGYTTKVDRVRAQLKSRRGGAADARLFCVVTTRESVQGRFYRLPTKADQEAFDAAAVELERREKEDGTQRSQKGRKVGEGIEKGQGSRRSLVPDEVISLNELRRVSVPIYGMERWGDLFSPRQALALTTLARLVRGAGGQMELSADAGLAEAVMTCLAFALDKLADKLSTHTGWKSTAEYMGGHTFGRQAIGMVWDWCEANPFLDASGSWVAEIEWITGMTEHGTASVDHAGHVEQASATNHPLPDAAAAAFVTDPPYYDAVPYAYLSDFFYVWMRRTLADVHPALFREGGVPKDAEIVVDRPHHLSQSTKDIAFYERELTRAFAEGRRVLAPSGVGTIVFASKTTASWEAILKAVIDAGFIITGSWPIDTEMETRLAGMGQARLGSSVHIVVRRRENEDGSVSQTEIGDWRDVLDALPRKMHQWMPRLAEEGVVGADAIFACLGPALEVFSRYSRVEKTSGEAVLLREYLEHVWGAVAHEALSLIFKDPDAAGLEPDARLTAMWLWTLGAATPMANGNDRDTDGETDQDSDDEVEAGAAKASGFLLEFDAARKIAQGLGIHLEKLATLVEIKGDKARLLPVAERTRALFGKDASADSAAPKRPRKKTTRQVSLFAEMNEIEEEEADTRRSGELKAPPAGSTVLDRVHQAMLLFAAGRGEALKRFLVEDAVGKDARFWKLAQSLSALYPSGIDEKRWVDGVLARKKGHGL